MDHLKLTVDKLSVEAISDLVVDSSCGAVSLFVGTTRDNFQNKKVLQLEYEAYETMALKALKGICDEVRSQWPTVHSIAIYHRLGIVPCREASVVIAVSSPHRRESLDAVSLCIEKLKANVPIWKKEVYQNEEPVWKENVECIPEAPRLAEIDPEIEIDRNLIQINVSSEELQNRIQNFIERKREQVNLNNIRDFIPKISEVGEEETDTCARVRTQFVRRNDSKGHLKIRKVHNEWGPQTVNLERMQEFGSACGVPTEGQSTSLPVGLAERVMDVERFLGISSVSRDVFRRLKDMEDKIAHLQSISPEYAQFWKNKKEPISESDNHGKDYAFSADDIARKIEMLERERQENS